MKKIIVSLMVLVNIVLADFNHLSVTQTQKMLDDKVVVIDIRTSMEWLETGVVPSSHMIEFFDMAGKYNIPKWMAAFEKVVTSKNQPFVLVCRTASRTKIVGDFLANKMGYVHTNDLEGGVVAWRMAGKKFEQAK